MKKISLILVTLLVLLSSVFAGCGSSGIPQADYDALQAKYDSSQSALAQANTEKTAVQTDLQKAEGDLNNAMSQNADLTAQLNNFKEQYGIEGLTTLEIVTKLVKNYSDTHFYIKDVYDCNNYACDFWDILMQAGINTEAHPAVIVIGDKDKQITDILLSNHAWVLVDLGNGEKIAVDPTGGIIINRTENPNYYRGWAFGTPADLKANDDLRADYNARVNYINAMITEINAAMELYNNASNQIEADKYFLLYTKLKQIKEDQQAMLVQVKAQIESFATKL